MLSDIILNLEGERREAYVRAVLRASGSNDVVGYIGRHIPTDIFDAIGLMALPVYGVDGDILKFSVERGLCPLIDATLTYAKTDRCPLIHSSRLIVVDDGCPVMAREMARLTGKDVYIYHGSDSERIERLTAKLEAVYGRHIERNALAAARAGRERCAALLHRLKTYSELSGLQIYILEYYLNFLTVSERMDILCEVTETVKFSDTPGEFIPVRIQSGGGIYRGIDRIMAGRAYRIMEEGCYAERTHYDFVYENCPFAEGTKISYDILREGN